MAGAEIIGAAIGVLLLVLVGYIMVGSTLTSAEIVANAQKDLTMQNEARLRTSIEISDVNFVKQGSSPPPYNLSFNLTNTGSEVIGDFNYIDTFVALEGNAPVHLSFDATEVPSGGDYSRSHWAYTIITPDNIHPQMLDPDEIMMVRIINIPISTGPLSYSITVTTSNGVSDTYNV